MSTIKQIEEAIEQLPPEELAKFRAWFSEYDSERWDRQIEQELPLDDLTGWLKRRWPIFAKAAAGICETPGEPTVLAVLPCFASGSAEACRGELSVAQVR